MAWNDVVANVREKIRRGLGRESSGQEIQLADQGTRLERLGDAPIATPIVDVYENDKELLIHADVPGGTRDGATVAWDEGRGLTFLVKSQGLPAGSIWASEYRPSDWYRALELPEYVDGSRATSAIKDGVLTIRIPKRAAASKLIQVKAG
jgi:HSP20 family molecular chaperone IbpA